MSNSRVEFNMLKLQETARTRWFKTLEVQQILKNVEDSNLSPFVCTKLPERPTNGSFFIVDASQAGKKWKQDGYSYVKRNNGVGFREDVVYLKIGGVKEVMCSYSHLDQGLLDQASYPLCRRIYKLVNKQGEKQYYLVHYFNEKNSDFSNEKNQDSPKEYQTETPYSNMSTSDDIKSDGKYDSYLSPSNPQADFIDKDENNDFFMENSDKNLGFISYFASPPDNETTAQGELFLDTVDTPNRIFSDPCSDQKNNNHIIAEEMKTENNPFSSHFFTIKDKISEIETRLSTLEITKNKPMFEEIAAFAQYEVNTNFSIIDFSPEWDYTKGGAKVLICVNPLCNVAEAANSKLKVQFGDTSVSGYFLQPGVIKCFAPAHPEGFVKISLLIDGEVISMRGGNQMFEYRKMQKKERVEKPSRRIEILDRDANKSQEFKVRVIEKLREYTNMFAQPNAANNNDNLFRQYTNANLQEVENLQTFLPENDLLEILKFMISDREKDNTFLNYLNKLNGDGYAIVHYLCFLQYNKCLDYILKNGALPTISSNFGITPLEISLKLKDETMLDILLANGALGPKKMRETLQGTRNTEESELDIYTLYKDRNLLDILLREVSLCDSIHNSLSMPPGHVDADDEFETSSYISWYDLLEQKDEELVYNENNDASRQRANQTPAGDRKPRRPNQKPRRYLRNYDGSHNNKKPDSQKSDEKDLPASAEVAAFADHENQIQLIQKNVRMWLLRRQYLDILHSTRVLQQYIRGKLAKKKINEDSLTKLISNKVNDWLNIKKSN